MRPTAWFDGTIGVDPPNRDVHVTDGELAYSMAIGVRVQYGDEPADDGGKP